MPIDMELAGRRFRLPTLDDFDPAGKRVLVRVDFNVPLAAGDVGDDTRLRAALPNLNELLDRGASLVLMSHLGRPKGLDPAFSMRPVASRLSQLLGREVRTVDAVTGPDVDAAARGLEAGQVLLLENLRFDPGEKKNDPHLAAALAALGDVFVNDAFGTAHRAAASVVGVARHLPSYAGRLMARELEVLSKALAAPATPFIVVLGGAKIGDKIGVIDALLPKADLILVGGGMANTFLSAQGVPMGDSLVEDDRLSDARRILEDAGAKLVLPTDLTIADAFQANAATKVVDAGVGVPDGWRAMDVGPGTLTTFGAHLQTARTVVWNGPMGVFELGPFAVGTFSIGEVLAHLEHAVTIVGGGDSVAAIRAAGLMDDIDWVSTGGGASLELLEGKWLPAVAALVGDL